ncbi:hypothetical protein WDW89_01355 [Deltaproteobacteria bacterium TL4]
MRNTFLLWLAGFIAAGLMTGCYTVKFYNDTHPLAAEPDGVLEVSSTIFATTVAKGPAVLRQICPSGVSKVEVQQSLKNGISHYLSLGFYSPQTLKIWCR